MPNEYPRSHRVADFLQRELAEVIRTELKDPRISPMLTISSVDVTRDLSVAKIYFTVMDSAERLETEAALQRATGFLRRHLAHSLKTRSVPQLRFYYDDSSERGAYMSALIDKAVASNTTRDDDAAGSSGEPEDSGRSSIKL